MTDSKYANYAEQLYKAMKGLGTDENTLIKVTTSVNLNERIKIKDKYKKLYGRDLLDDLKSDLSGNFLKVMLALYKDKYEYDAEQLYLAMKGMGTDEDALIEIIGTRPVWMLKKIKNVYKQLYKNDLEKDVKSDTSGDFQKMLISLLQCNRSQNTEVDTEKCIKICEELYNAGEKKLGTDEHIFNKYFANCSPAELMTIAREYHKAYGNPLMKVIDSEFSGDIKNLIKTVFYASISPSEYFATRIHQSVKGMGTNEKILNRVIVTRNEIDIDIITKYYKLLYSKDMLEDIKGDTSGDYKKLLVALIDKN